MTIIGDTITGTLIGDTALGEVLFTMATIAGTLGTTHIGDMQVFTDLPGVGVGITHITVGIMDTITGAGTITGMATTAEITPMVMEEEALLMHTEITTIPITTTEFIAAELETSMEPTPTLQTVQEIILQLQELQDPIPIQEVL